MITKINFSIFSDIKIKISNKKNRKETKLFALIKNMDSLLEEAMIYVSEIIQRSNAQLFHIFLVIFSARVRKTHRNRKIKYLQEAKRTILN